MLENSLIQNNSVTDVELNIRRLIRSNIKLSIFLRKFKNFCICYFQTVFETLVNLVTCKQ